MSFPYQTDYVNVSLDDTGTVAILHWKRAVTLEEFKNGYNRLAQLIHSTGVRRWMVNSFQRGPITKEAEEWLFSSFLRSFPKMLAQAHLLALVMDDEFYQMTIHDYSLARANSTSLPIAVNFFTDENEAMQWIREEPLIDPATLHKKPTEEHP